MKKEKYTEDEIDDAAIAAAMNMGAPENALAVGYGKVIHNGNLTLAGAKMMEDSLEDFLAKNPRTSKYWICNTCAAKKGWNFPKWPVTATSGLCGHCDRTDTQALIPTSDFGGKNKKPVWD